MATRKPVAAPKEAPAPGSQTNKVDPASPPINSETPRVLGETQKKPDANDNPKTQLVTKFKEIASVVGAGKAKRILVENYGAEEPETLKASELLDAIDMLYGSA